MACDETSHGKSRHQPQPWPITADFKHKGDSISDVHKHFWISPPPCPQLELIITIKLMQPPLLRPLSFITL